MPSRQNIRLGEACDRYLERITQQGQSVNTITMTKFALEQLRKTTAKGGYINPLVHTISPADMDDYCYGPNGMRSNSTRTGKPLRASTFNRYRSALRTFFGYAVTMGWTDVNPMLGIASARPESPRAHLLLSATELLSVLDHTHNPVERIGCSIAMNTALRGGDVTRLKIFDANLIGGVLQTEITKSKKIDNKPITMDLHFELTRWLNQYAEIMGCAISELHDDWYLVPSYCTPPRGQKIVLRPLRQLTNPWRLVQRPLERMGYPVSREGMHTLRRSSARVLFESLRQAGEGHDHALLIVSEFLNHSNVIVTQRYLGLNHERDIRNSLLKGKPFLSALAQGEQNKLDQEGFRVQTQNGPEPGKQVANG